MTEIVKVNYKKKTLNKLFLNLKNKFDGLILAINPKEQSEILIEILKHNIPIIVEKPICINKLYFEKILKYKKKNQIIYVNHYHLFSESFKKFQKSFKISEVKNIYIEDGNFGPFRKNVSPIFDWGPHSFGIILNYLT